MKTNIENGYRIKDNERIEDYIVDQLERINHKLENINNKLKWN